MKTTWMIGLMCVFTTFCFGQESKKQLNNRDSAIVLVSFIVNLNGSITKVKIKNFECSACSEEDKKNYQDEAIRVVKATPNMGERKEKARYLLPIKFKTED